MNGPDMAHAGRSSQASPRPPQLFVSYAPADQQRASVLVTELRQSGFAVGGTPPQAVSSALPQLAQAGQLPECIVILLTPAAIQSPLVADEMRIASALLRRGELRGVLAIAATPPSGDKIPADWPIMRIIDATRDYTTAMDQLVAAIQTLIPGRRPENPPPQPAMPAMPATPAPRPPVVPVPRLEPMAAPAPEPAPRAPLYPPEEETARVLVAPEVADISQLNTERVLATHDVSQLNTERVPAANGRRNSEGPEWESIRTPAMPARSRRSVAQAAPITPLSPIPTPNASPARPEQRQNLMGRRLFLRAGVAVAGAIAVGGAAYVWRSSQNTVTKPGPVVRWRFDISQRPSTLALAGSSPDAVIYVGTNEGHLYAIDASSHEQRWVFSASAAIAPAMPVVANGAVYFSATDNTFYSVSDDPAITDDAQRLHWHFRVSQQVLQPTVGDGVIYVPSLYYRLHALDSATGAVLWVSASPVNPSSPVTLGDNRLYVAADKTIFALDLTGNQVWRGPAMGTIHGNLPLANGLLYAGTLENAVYALDAATGTQRWKFATAGQINSTPVLDAGSSTVYIGGGDGNIYAINATSGALRWQQKLDSALGTPVLMDGRLYVSTDFGNLYALDAATGVMYWQYAASQGIVTPLGAEARTVYAGTIDGFLYALAEK